MQNSLPIRKRKPSEDGFLLLAAIFMLALLVIALSIAVPEVTKSIQRDREVETMHRGKQYARAIQLYYRSFNTYPPSIDALVKTNNIRFLRKKYIDPMTGKDDWKPVLFGQNKTPLAMGFFGQPLGGLSGASPLAGTGPSGGNTAPGAGLTGPAGGGSSSIGGGGFNAPGSIFGSAGQTGAPGAGIGATPASSGTDANGNPVAGAGNTGATGGTTGTAAGAAGTAGGASGSSGSGFMSGQTGQTFGGAGIVGVSPASPRQSILIYKKKDHFMEWEFTYSPLIEMQQQGAASGNLMPGSGTNGQSGTPGFGGTGTTSGFGGTGASSGFGGTGASPGFGGGSGGSGFGGTTFGGTGGGMGSGSPSSPTQPQQ